MPIVRALSGALSRFLDLVASWAGRAWVRMPAPVRRLTALHWSWIHAKVALGSWAVLLFTFTPTKVASAWGVLLTVTIVGMTLSGCVISILGLVLSAPDQGMSPTSSRRRWLGVELFGLWWMLLGGVGAYMLTQFGLTFQTDGDQRIALTAFAYAMCAFLIARIAMVVHRRRKELRLAELRGDA